MLVKQCVSNYTEYIAALSKQKNKSSYKNIHRGERCCICRSDKGCQDAHLFVCQNQLYSIISRTHTFEIAFLSFLHMTRSLYTFCSMGKDIMINKRRYKNGPPRPMANQNFSCRIHMPTQKSQPDEENYANSSSLRRWLRWHRHYALCF